MLEVLGKYNLKIGLILTQDEEYEEIVGNKKIVVEPVWKWLME